MTPRVVRTPLLDALDLRRINLFCQDWGGPTSLRNACDDPDRYARLFIGNTWLHHDSFEYTEALRTWRSMATEPQGFGPDMPTGTIVGYGRRRPDGDLDALRVAYDAPFTGVESKAGARRFPWCLPFAEPEAGGAAWRWSRRGARLSDLDDRVLTIERNLTLEVLGPTEAGRIRSRLLRRSVCRGRSRAPWSQKRVEHLVKRTTTYRPGRRWTNGRRSRR